MDHYNSQRLSCLSVCLVTLFYCGQTVGWIKMSLGTNYMYEGRPRPRPHCVRWGSSYPHGKRHSSPSTSSADVYCGQTVAVSAAAELLLQYQLIVLSLFNCEQKQCCLEHGGHNHP